MLDVHPPHHSANTWRDFMIHIATIVVGLLIAIGLEQSVEYLHGRHLLHHTETNLRQEMRDNRERLRRDEAQLDTTEASIEKALVVIANAQASHAGAVDPAMIDLRWSWDGPRSVSWDAARANGAVVLMPYDVSEAWSTIYSQQTVVDTQTAIYIRDIYRVEGPLSRDRQLATLRPEQLAAITADAYQLRADLRLLRDLCESLDRVYNNVGPTVE